MDSYAIRFWASLMAAIAKKSEPELKEMVLKSAVDVFASAYIAVSGKTISFGLTDRSVKPWRRKLGAAMVVPSAGFLAIYAVELRRRRALPPMAKTEVAQFDLEAFLERNRAAKNGG